MWLELQNKTHVVINWSFPSWTKKNGPYKKQTFEVNVCMFMYVSCESMWNQWLHVYISDLKYLSCGYIVWIHHMWRDGSHVSNSWACRVFFSWFKRFLQKKRRKSPRYRSFHLTLCFSSHHISSHTVGFFLFKQMKPICVDLCLQPIRERMLLSCAFRNTVDVTMF